MITTRYLNPDEYHKFGWWLKGLNEQDRRLYFGINASDAYIDKLIARITSAPDQHTFLVSWNQTGWLGVLHIARISDDSIEFAISVYEEYRNFGIGTDLLTQGITWARNRGYKQLYLHCVRWNTTMAHLANKLGLETVAHDDERDVSATLKPPSWYSLQQETMDINRRLFHMFLNRTFFNFQESCV